MRWTGVNGALALCERQARAVTTFETCGSPGGRAHGLGLRLPARQGLRALPRLHGRLHHRGPALGGACLSELIRQPKIKLLQVQPCAACLHFYVPSCGSLYILFALCSVYFCILIAYCHDIPTLHLAFGLFLSIEYDMFLAL